MNKEKHQAPTDVENWIGLSNPDANQVFIWGEIDDSMLKSVVEPLIICSVADCPLEIYISTPGGYIRVAMVIADIIEKLRIPTTIYVMGELASAGFVIPLAGYSNPNVYRIALPSSRALWHSGEIEMGMSFHQACDYIDFQKDESLRIEDYIKSHSKMSKEMIRECFRREYWMLPEEMLELEIVDEIL